MIAADTSSLIAYFAGEDNRDTIILDQALKDGILVLPPMVLSEALSDPKLPKLLAKSLKSIPLLRISENFWSDVGQLRCFFLKKKRKAHLADSMIAQTCIDNDVPLITRDRDFKKYQKYFGLTLL